MWAEVFFHFLKKRGQQFCSTREKIIFCYCYLPMFSLVPQSYIIDDKKEWSLIVRIKLFNIFTFLWEFMNNGTALFLNDFEIFAKGKKKVRYFYGTKCHYKFHYHFTTQQRHIYTHRCWASLQILISSH